MSDVKIIAIVELGTTAIRMEIAEIPPRGMPVTRDKLQKALALGRDTFTSGSIASETIEHCVQILRTFKRVMAEYGISRPGQIHAIATSAVREASNRDVFLDRILIATDIHVHVIDAAEVSRLTYHAVRSALSKETFFKSADILVMEVGGGSTEALVFKKGKVNSSHVYRMGALRVSRAVAEYNESRERSPGLIQSQIHTTIDQIKASIGKANTLKLLALGSETRLAAARLQTSERTSDLPRIKVDDLATLAEHMLGQPTDQLVREYGLSYPEAETLGTALMIYVELARALHLKSILVGEANLRSGLLAEMATSETWTQEFQRQILSSAKTLGKKYNVDERHARNVKTYAAHLFEALKDEHGLETRHAAVLGVAAWLHECGLFIGTSGHHKHSMYIILNSDIFGLGRRDIELAALVARYHRRAVPKSSHTRYAALPRDQRITVAKLAAILRVANALDRERSKRPINFTFTLADGLLTITERTNMDLTAARLRVRERSELFEQVYGMRVELRSASGG